MNIEIEETRIFATKSKTNFALTFQLIKPEEYLMRKTFGYDDKIEKKIKQKCQKIMEREIAGLIKKDLKQKADELEGLRETFGTNFKKQRERGSHQPSDKDLRRLGLGKGGPGGLQTGRKVKSLVDYDGASVGAKSDQNVRLFRNRDTGLRGEGRKASQTDSKLSSAVKGGGRRRGSGEGVENDENEFLLMEGAGGEFLDSKEDGRGLVGADGNTVDLSRMNVDEIMRFTSQTKFTYNSSIFSQKRLHDGFRQQLFNPDRLSRRSGRIS